MVLIKNRQLHKKLIKMLAPEFFLERRKTKIIEEGDLIDDVKKDKNSKKTAGHYIAYDTVHIVSSLFCCLGVKSKTFWAISQGDT
jgi:hypothetical protein